MQNVLISGARLSRRPFEFGNAFRRYREQFEASQWWTREDLDAWQLEQLRRLLRHAYENVPAYRELYRKSGVNPDDVRTLRDVEKLPIVSKADIRHDPFSFMARNARRFRPVPLHTSGTTGTPFHFQSDRITEAIEWVFFWRHKSWGGAHLFAPMISLGGKMIVPLKQRRPPFWRYNWAEGIMWLSTFHMTPEVLELYIDKIRRSGLRFLRGYPSNLFILAQHLKSRDLHLPMAAVFSGSEPLFGYVRDLIEDRFQCRVFDWYGVSERVVTSSQCDRHDGYHVHMENCLVEIVDANQPVERGMPGEVVATCLSNYAMPLIRYRTGDRSAFRTVSCPCGRGLEMLEQVHTKCEDILTTSDGRYISPSVLTHPFKPILGIDKSQIVQEDPGFITIKVVANAAFDANQQQVLINGLADRLGENTRIEIEHVSDIPKEPSGKYRWVISKVPHPFNDELAREKDRQFSGTFPSSR